ncbi:response regulator transcription factor [Cellulomonas alba]|uniref:Response regulator transcription factor n=1 Tax=Cellulomonas alba TaxID=3053467 RepID=A0ABT7SBT0_9CELL|nr:response regulator transcription factor [Cellulomonas alba]MDM7853534.1 response regulator transcription factor [Cellulomonas alba]
MDADLAEPRASLLLVEDDRTLGPLLAEALGDAYEVVLVRDSHSALHVTLTQHPDLLVVDRGLPDGDGIDLVRRLRRAGVGAPVLVLTARGTLADRVDGLDAGAEDYLVKPFELPELLARLRALLRRHGDDAPTVAVGTARLDVESRTVTRAGGAPVDLTDRECAVLAMLARRPTRVFSRDEILAEVFDPHDTPNTVDTYVHYLRRKLGRGAVTTVRGIGYRLGGV